MDTWLRSLVPGWLARRPLGQPLVTDLVLALVLALLAVTVPLSAEDADIGASLAEPDGVGGWLLVAGAAWAVPFRRIVPLTALLAGSVLQIVVWTVGYPDTFVSTAVLLYSAAAHGHPGRRGWVWACAVFLTVYTSLGVVTAEVPIYAIPLVGLFGAAATALGSTTSARQAYTEAAEARAAELERSRQTDRDRALSDERARIARELHDVVAHGLSVIVVQAAAARRILDRDPDGAATALGQIEATGRDALGEMRHVLSAIRTEPDESWRPTKSLADLEALVAEFGSTGLPVTVRHAWSGDGTDEPTEVRSVTELEPLPATIDVTAYRVVQESLTNVLKHGGPGAEARVEVIRRPGRLDLRITDDGRGALDDDGCGHGLRGMQERVEVFGGRFSAGPRLGGGYTVEANLPLEIRSPAATTER